MAETWPHRWTGVMKHEREKAIEIASETLAELRHQKEQAMLLQPTKFPHLQPTVNRDDYNWLEVHAPDYLESVERELNDGKTPDEIHRFLLNQIGQDRAALARRCLNAARWIKANRES